MKFTRFLVAATVGILGISLIGCESNNNPPESGSTWNQTDNPTYTNPDRAAVQNPPDMSYKEGQRFKNDSFTPPATQPSNVDR